MKDSLFNQVDRFVRAGIGDFDALALEVFAHQFTRNAPYAAFCTAQGKTPANVSVWNEIPAVPIRAFKSATLATFPTGQASAIFESSRTTGQEPSRHYLRDLRLYETACSVSFKTHVLKGDETKRPFLLLTPGPGEAPRSSLTWMLDTVARRYASASRYFVRNGRLDDLALSCVLSEYAAQAQPVYLLGTTLAFLAFFQRAAQAGQRFPLAKGSRIFDTGGMKGTQREVSRTEFVDQAERVFDVTQNDCVNEYGMCEMSSQFYGTGRSTWLTGAPWTRTLVMDPVTLTPAAEGKEGVLRHFDLANVDSVMAIQTEDIGWVERDGFTLVGRATGAELKGCSLLAEAF